MAWLQLNIVSVLSDDEPVEKCDMRSPVSYFRVINFDFFPNMQ